MCQVVAIRCEVTSLSKQFCVMVGREKVAEALLHIFHTKTRIYAEIHDVLVMGEHRRRGYGIILLNGIRDFVTQYAAEQQHDVHIRFTSGPHRKAANHLYQKLGYPLLAKATKDGTNYYGAVTSPKGEQHEKPTDYATRG